jgi:hypothetical protein
MYSADAVELGSEDVTSQERSRIKNVLSFFQCFHSASVLIKHVQITLILDVIIDILPDSRFVVLWRDGRASVESLICTVILDPDRQNYSFGQYGLLETINCGNRLIG